MVLRGVRGLSPISLNGHPSKLQVAGEREMAEKDMEMQKASNQTTPLYSPVLRLRCSLEIVCEVGTLSNYC